MTDTDDNTAERRAKRIRENWENRDAVWRTRKLITDFYNGNEMTPNELMALSEVIAVVRAHMNDRSL